MTPSVTSPPTPATNEALTMIDILGVIFEACLALNFSVEWHNDVRQKMALGAVCRCWKFTLESLPALWSHIILVPRMPQYYIDKVFRLAKQAPKRLRIDLDLDSELDTMFLSSIAALLVAKAETVTHISVQYISYSAWNTFVDHLSAASPQPRFLSLRSFYVTSPTALHNQLGDAAPHSFPDLAANLQDLYLDGLLPSSFVVGANLISLSLTNLYLAEDDTASFTFTTTLLDSLRQTPHLETLFIDVDESFTNQPVPHKPVVLPYLHTLSFLCNMPFPHHCGFLLSLVHLPKLHSLSLHLVSVQNVNNFISVNGTHLSTIVVLRLIGDISAYIEFTGGRAKLLSSLTGSRLRHLDFLDVDGLFPFDSEHNVFVQTQFLEILAHTLSLPAVCLLVIPPLFSPPRPASRASLIRSLLEPVAIQAEPKRIFEEHALCVSIDDDHSKCGRMWSWDHCGLAWENKASHFHAALLPIFYMSTSS
ncbi:hypothetical protein MIND_00088200 [Mycena indigotica]|uniref:Uncharacterized protein n=1 Tax=Mycena indigotica TaxID=2126181 RepID=A0A8H6TBI0_9AGAR|nr:uncharacterized protein MIND_00088200 [Mycena indigotica]KAF7315725.1 hypothetical protein MIND_00088200 [Mycena indigotica]